MASLDLKQLEGKPWYYGLGIGVAIAIALYAAAYYQLPNFSEMKQTLENKKNELDQLNQKINQGRAAERRRTHQENPGVGRTGRVLPQEVGSEGVHQQGLLCGVADRPAGRWDLPQPCALLREGGAFLADHQHRGPRHGWLSRRGRRTHAGRELHDEDLHLSRGHRRGRARRARPCCCCAEEARRRFREEGF